MKWQLRGTLSIILVLGAVLAVLGAARAQTQDGTAPVPHQAGQSHPFQPARLEATMYVDMGEFFFANLEGARNPEYRLPADTTVGIHIHNEGVILHELAIGRTVENGEYAELLTQLVPSDLFFYYGRARVEVEDVRFGEIEVDPGIKDMWIRINVPAEFKGRWELGCFVEGHFEAGMRATLIIE
jgi:uncharacterized cupredoxin-like copper-binding protein